MHDLQDMASLNSTDSGQRRSTPYNQPIIEKQSMYWIVYNADAYSYSMHLKLLLRTPCDSNYLR